MSFSAWLYIDQPMNNLRILDMAVGHDNENIMIGPIGTPPECTRGGWTTPREDAKSIIGTMPPRVCLRNGFISPPPSTGAEPRGARMKVYKNGAFVGQSGTDKSPPDNITRGQQWLEEALSVVSLLQGQNG